MTKVQELLKSKNREKCKCGHIIVDEDMSYTNHESEYGTGSCYVNAFCPKCETTIFECHSWYPSIDDEEDLYRVIDENLDALPSNQNLEPTDGNTSPQ